MITRCYLQSLGSDLQSADLGANLRSPAQLDECPGVRPRRRVSAIVAQVVSSVAAESRRT